MIPDLLKEASKLFALRHGTVVQQVQELYDHLFVNVSRRLRPCRTSVDRGLTPSHCPPPCP
eukprot:7223610-Prymnesium_polylepis.1